MKQFEEFKYDVFKLYMEIVFIEEEYFQKIGCIFVLLYEKLL